MLDMDDHFSAVAEKYNYIRTTDTEPIDYIRERLSNYQSCAGVDVGCGPGRYDLLLLQMMPQLHLTCLDRSSRMVEETERLLQSANIDRYKVMIANAAELPIESNSVDVIFTFNAVHHFILPTFLREARRTLKEGGTIEIYTRLRSQNEASIWGTYFPDFSKVERRLYSLDEIDATVRGIPGLALDTVKLFHFDRVSSLDDLIAKAKGGHYSTFRLYNEKRFQECILEFSEKLTRNYSDVGTIRWTDENVFVSIKACELIDVIDRAPS